MSTDRFCATVAVKVGVGVFVGSKVAVLAGKEVAVLVGNEIAVLVGKEVAVLADKGVAVLVGAGTIVLVGKGVSEGVNPLPVVADGITRVGENTGSGVSVTGWIVAVDAPAAVSVGKRTGVWVTDLVGALVGLEVPTNVEIGSEARVGVAVDWLEDRGT
jgi:hypothetical protein